NMSSSSFGSPPVGTSSSGGGTIEFRCTHCNKLLRTAADAVGRQVRCPQCQTVLAVPKMGANPGLDGYNIQTESRQPVGTQQASTSMERPMASPQALASASNFGMPLAPPAPAVAPPPQPSVAPPPAYLNRPASDAARRIHDLFERI